MKAIALPLIILLISYQIAAQNSLPVFGNVTLAELQMQECNFEKSASAYKILDYQKTEIRRYATSEDVAIDNWVKLKIFNKQGFKYADVSIPYIGSNKISKIINIEGYVYTLKEGKVIEKLKVSESDILKNKSRQTFGLNMLSFTFPGLEEGCIVEYRYRTVINLGLRDFSWNFQKKIPVALSYCEVQFPDYYVLDKKIFSDDSVTITDFTDLKQSVNMRYFFVRQNVPAFRAEPFMSSHRDYQSRIDYTIVTKGSSFLRPGEVHSTKGLDNMIFYYASNALRPIRGTSYIIDSIKKIENRADQISAIYNVCKQMLTWNGIQSREAGDPEECWKTKSGSSSEINLVMYYLLQNLKIPSFPLLISTRENGKTSRIYTVPSEFNGLDILVVDSTSKYVLDATQKTGRYDIPPVNIVNRDAYLIDNQMGQWLFVGDDGVVSKTSLSALSYIDSAGVITGAADILYSGYAKINRLNDIEQKDINELNENSLLNYEFNDIVIDTFYRYDSTSEKLPLGEKIKFHFDLSNTGQLYFINPFFLSIMASKPFVEEKRISDIDFGQSQKIVSHIYINLPDNMQVEELPENKAIRMSDSSINFQRIFDKSDQMISCYASFEINRPLIDKADYVFVKDFFERVYTLFNEEIVISRKE